MSSDRKQDKDEEGPLGDKRPGAAGSADTEGGLPQEKVEDRPNVGQVRPEDYPEDQRAKG